VPLEEWSAGWPDLPGNPAIIGPSRGVARSGAGGPGGFWGGWAKGDFPQPPRR